MADTRNRVILARPHPFIVESMKAFLTRNGYEPLPIDNLDKLREVMTSEVCGAIISTSVASSVNHTPHDVLAKLKQYCPKVPVAFASLLDDFTQVKPSLLRTLAGVADGAKLEPINEKTFADSSLGTGNTFVFISKSDLDDEKRRFLVDSVVKKHFKRLGSEVCET